MRLSGVVDTATGLGKHDHVGWVSDRPADFREHAGRVLITSVGTLDGPGEAVEPPQQSDMFSQAARQAVADGWTGLRVAADVTSLVRTERRGYVTSLSSTVR